MVEIVIETVFLKFRRSYELLTQVANRLNQEVGEQTRRFVWHTNLEHGASGFLQQDQRRAMQARAEKITNA